MWKPNVHVTSNRCLVQYRFIGGGWLPLLLCSIMLGAIYIPYFIVLLRGTLHPILPFVSQAAGSPPQNGLFSVLLSLSALVSFIGLHLLHMGIRLHSERLEIKNSREVVDLLNKAILIPGHIAILGMMIVGGYPIDFHRHNEDWMYVTIVPHLIGAGSLFIGGIFYCILLTYIMSVIHPEKTDLRNTRLFIIAVIVFCAALHAATVNTAFMKEYHDMSRLRSCVTEPIQYDLHYIICSVCEWVMLTSFVCYFATIRDESKHMSLCMTITLDENPLSLDDSKQLSKSNQDAEEKKENLKALNMEKETIADVGN